MSTEPASIATTVLDLAMRGDFAEIHDMFAPPLQTMVSVDALRAAWTGELGQYGTFAGVGAPISEPDGTVKIPLMFEHATRTLVVAVDGGGQLIGLRLAPAEAAAPMVPWEPPDYVSIDEFDETDVVLGDGPLAVPGTLSVPRRAGAGPAVLVLSGSGPNDRDETIGRNKPMKDLAWGLASRGIVVLRFDKVTFAHPAEVVAQPDFTITDEYLPQARAAIDLLRTHESVDPNRIFLLGHSLGGTVAPRVAQAEPRVAGLVLLAGGTEPMHRAGLRQFRYLAETNPGLAAAVETMAKQVAVVDSPDLTASTPASELPFGVPAPYWLDVRDYRPGELAATLHKPMLVLQGGRDYQVTVDDDLPAWRAGVPDATFRVYEQDNHLFFVGSGRSTAEEYEPAQHMDPAVVRDVAEWVLEKP